MAEWLRRGLQILAPRFDSGSGLQFFDGCGFIVQPAFMIQLLAEGLSKGGLLWSHDLRCLIIIKRTGSFAFARFQNVDEKLFSALSLFGRTTFDRIVGAANCLRSS
jgi:hypothetical protein